MIVMQGKDKWIRSLKVGDKVCDCRYEHLAIKEIMDDTMVWRPPFYWWIVDLFPTRVQDWIDDTWEIIGRRLGIECLVDRTLILEDNSQCSAMHCCDPVAHDWDHILRRVNKEKRHE
jgi:hypothetical protein